MHTPRRDRHRAAVDGDHGVLPCLEVARPGRIALAAEIHAEDRPPVAVAQVRDGGAAAYAAAPPYRLEREHRLAPTEQERALDAPSRGPQHRRMEPGDPGRDRTRPCDEPHQPRRIHDDG